MLCYDTGSTVAVHIPTGTLKLAQQIQQMADVIANENVKGNGEIIIKLKVTGGKICQFFNFAGKWFSGTKDTK